jgi:hypothetical protein
MSNIILQNNESEITTEEERPRCLCGCSKNVTKKDNNGNYRNYCQGHKKNPVPKESPPLCFCGCNKQVVWSDDSNKWNLYIHGHHVNKCWLNEEYKLKIKESKRKYYANPEHIKELSERSKENQNRPEVKLQKSKAQKNRYNNPEERKKTSEKSKAMWAINKEKMIKAIKEHYIKNPDSRLKCSQRSKKSHNTPETKLKLSLISKKNWTNSEYIIKVLKAINIKPNKPESIINALTPGNVRYVGNRQWWRKLMILENGEYIERYKNPDFKVKDQKKVIEVHGDYWHKGEDTNALIQAYKDVGIECLVIWEHEIKSDIESVLNRIADFVGYQSWQMSLNI